MEPIDDMENKVLLYLLINQNFDITECPKRIWLSFELLPAKLIVCSQSIIDDSFSLAAVRPKNLTV